jgi:aspartyl aminopeptidase
MSTKANIEGLLNFLDASPTPHHAVESCVAILGDEFTKYEFSDEVVPNVGYMRIEGTLIAWKFQSGSKPDSFNILGAHTDSPNLRIRPRPDENSVGLARLGVEIYGGALLNSWLDRDLGIAGQVVMTNGSEALVQTSGPIARIPQLAIHLDREVNDRGLVLDRHQHLLPIWASLPTDGRFADWVAEQLSTTADEIASWSLSLFDCTPAAVIGADASLLSSGRIDNLLSCWSASVALSNSDPSADTVKLIALFDHEEVGSNSSNGAASPLLDRVLQVIASALQIDEHKLFAMIAASLFISADNGHGIHPNYQDRHDHQNAPVVNRGVAIKINESHRYSSTPATVARMLKVFDRTGQAPQVFVSRNNIPCGSTIGPIAATNLGMPAVDIGVPQLSMHSAREICGIGDALHLVALCNAYFEAAS